MYVSTSCTVVSLSTTGVNFNTFTRVACSHKQKFKTGQNNFALNVVTVGVQVSHVAGLVQSSSSLLHERQRNSRDSTDRSLLRSRGKFPTNFVAQSATVELASQYSWESGT